MNYNIIYKYFKIDEYFYRSIKNNYLWFSDPTNFNDPYGFNLFISKDFTEEDLRNYFSKTQLQGNSRDESSRNQIEKRIEEFKKNPDAFLNGYISQIRQKYSVCCFSKSSDILLMWSHYGDKHGGVCLGFDMNKDSDLFSAPINVEYPPEYPDFNFVKDRFTKRTGENLQFHFGTKSKDWEYEEEIRIVREIPTGFGNNLGIAVPFQKHSLVEVIFGYKTTPKKIEELKELFKQCEYSADFKQAKLKEYKFGIDIDPTDECRE